MYGKRSYYGTRRDQRQGNLLGGREKSSYRHRVEPRAFTIFIDTKGENSSPR